MLLLMSSKWLTTFFAKVKRRAIAKAFASGNKHCCKQRCYSAAIQAQGYEECLQRNAPGMQKHFLFCLHFVPSHNTWNLNASVRGSSLFCWKILIFSQKPTSSKKPQVLSLQKMEGKAILSDARAKGSISKCCSITQKELNVKAGDILAESRQLRMETRLSLLCNCHKMFPLHRRGERQRCSFRQAHLHPHCLYPQHLKACPQNTHIHQFFSKGSLFLFIYLRSLLSNSALFWEISRVPTPASHKAPARSTWVMVVGCSYENL